jgi:tRNA G10  N-methylase Trm11
VRIFDPFCGTATTALSSAYHGHEGVTTDINPFLVWLGEAKTAHYTITDIAAARDACQRAVELLRKEKVTPILPPPIYNIERWWSPTAINFLCTMRSAIDAVTEMRSPERNLMLIAFCRTLISLSNASFNHQSMSFKDTSQLLFPVEPDMPGLFAENVRFLLTGAAENPFGSAEVLLGDARSSVDFVQGKFDRVITSPPYSNRMSYIRELRPYMYWLGFLTNGRDAGELDWAAIGGTWGIATSRLIDWKRPNNHYENDVLEGIVEKISHVDNKNGALLSIYVTKYFEDMWLHFKNIIPVLSAGAQIHYIVGNSTFYGVLLPVEEVYAEMLKSLGFTDVKCRAIRKRNSKKELIEFDVSAVWLS